MTPEEFDALDELPDLMHGYRFDDLWPTGRVGYYGAPDPASPRIPEGDDEFRWTPQASCRIHGHIAPDGNCTCGWHVALSLPELVAYQPDHVTYIPARAAIVAATAYGPNMVGAASDDTDTTIRSTRLRMGDRIWIRKGVPRAIVSATRRHYPFARIERFHNLAELATVNLA